MRCICGGQFEPHGEVAHCPFCGLMWKAAPMRYTTLSVGDIFLGIFIGVILGAFVWTPIGRAAASAAIQRGGNFAKSQVESWLKQGEKK